MTVTKKEREDIEGLFRTLKKRSKKWVNGKDFESIANELIGNAYERAAHGGEDSEPVVGFAII